MRRGDSAGGNAWKGVLLGRRNPELAVWGRLGSSSLALRLRVQRWSWCS
jgi:hypothetical protein